MTRWLRLGGAGLVVLALGFVVGRWSAPARTETREVVRYVDRTVTEWRTHTVTIRGPVRTVERIVERPDGERVTDRTVEAAPVTVETGLEARQDSVRAAEVERTRVVEARRPAARVGLGAAFEVGSGARRLDAEVGGRIGPVWVSITDSVPAGSIGELRHHSPGVRLSVQF